MEHLSLVAQTMAINTLVWTDQVLITDLCLDLGMGWRRIRILIQKLGRMPIWETEKIAVNFMVIRQHRGLPIMVMAPHQEP
jgi:hypothetical protein